MPDTKWVVQHEMDDEPTYITPEDSQEGDYVTLGSDIPAAERLQIAKKIVTILQDELTKG